MGCRRQRAERDTAAGSGSALHGIAAEVHRRPDGRTGTEADVCLRRRHAVRVQEGGLPHTGAHREAEEGTAGGPLRRRHDERPRHGLCGAHWRGGAGKASRPDTARTGHRLLEGRLPRMGTYVERLRGAVRPWQRHHHRRARAWRQGFPGGEQPEPAPDAVRTGRRDARHLLPDRRIPPQGLPQTVEAGDQPRRIPAGTLDQTVRDELDTAYRLLLLQRLMAHEGRGRHDRRRCQLSEIHDVPRRHAAAPAARAEIPGGVEPEEGGQRPPDVGGVPDILPQRPEALLPAAGVVERVQQQGVRLRINHPLRQVQAEGEQHHVGKNYLYLTGLPEHDVRRHGHRGRQGRAGEVHRRAGCQRGGLPAASRQYGQDHAPVHVGRSRRQAAPQRGGGGYQGDHQRRHKGRQGGAGAEYQPHFPGARRRSAPGRRADGGSQQRRYGTARDAPAEAAATEREAAAVPALPELRCEVQPVGRAR